MIRMWFHGQTVGLLVAPAIMLCQIQNPGPEASSRDRQTRLIRSSAKLQCKLQLDRTVYFPAEDAILKITCVNSATETLEMLDPFQFEIQPFRRDSTLQNQLHEEWIPLVPNEGSSYLSEEAQTLWIQPGQKLEREFVFSDPKTTNPQDKQGRPILPAVCRWCRIPERVGEYRFRYANRGMVEFKVVDPKVESWQLVPFEKPYEQQMLDIQNKPTAQVGIRKRAALVMVLSSEGEHVVAVSRYWGYAEQQILWEGDGQVSWSSLRGFTPLVRVAHSKTPINSVQATTDATEKLAITYTDHERRTVRLNLDSKRALIPER